MFDVTFATVFDGTIAGTVIVADEDTWRNTGDSGGGKHDSTSRVASRCAGGRPDMKVLHVVSALHPGRAEHQLRLLVRRLPHDSEVATLSGEGVLAAPIRAGGVRVHDLSADRRSPVRKLRRLIRRGRFDLVHVHRYAAGVPGRLAARLAGVPVVATEHGDGLGPDHPFYTASERLGRMTVAVSAAVAARLLERGVPADRIAVIAPGIDTAEVTYDPGVPATPRPRLGIAPGAAVVGGIGRLVPGKRF